MERHKCKLCFRNFANGRALALGGHVRAHMMNLYVTKNSSKKDQRDEEFHSHSSQIDPKQSETESSTKKKRSKRVKKSKISSPLTSISDEDVAYCLMMMSRDKWGGNKENDYISDDFGVAKVEGSKVKRKYRCETCWRAFRSYQALGGHRASHKKVKVNAPPPLLGGGSAAAVVEEKIHECPFCDRVFTSGQALGGHKRSHFTTIRQISRNCGHLGIDLNLPAPIDDDNNIISK